MLKEQRTVYIHIGVYWMKESHGMGIWYVCGVEEGGMPSQALTVAGTPELPVTDG